MSANRNKCTHPYGTTKVKYQADNAFVADPGSTPSTPYSSLSFPGISLSIARFGPQNTKPKNVLAHSKKKKRKHDIYLTAVILKLPIKETKFGEK